MNTSVKSPAPVRLMILSCLFASLCACGGSGSSMSMSQPSATGAQLLTTAQVLNIAKSPSDTTEPFQASDGAVEIVDSSETSDALSVTGSF